MELPLGSRVGEHGPYAVSTPGGIFNIPSERVVRDYGHCIPIRKDQLKRLQKIGILENFCGASAWLLWKVRSMWIVVVRVPFQYLANADARASFCTRASNSPENDVCIWCVRFDIKMEERAPWAPSGQRPVGSTFLWPLTPPQAVSVYEKFKLDPKEQGSRLVSSCQPTPLNTHILTPLPRKSTFLPVLHPCVSSSPTTRRHRPELRFIITASTSRDLPPNDPPLSIQFAASTNFLLRVSPHKSFLRLCGPPCIR